MRTWTVYYKSCRDVNRVFTTLVHVYTELVRRYTEHVRWSVHARRTVVHPGCFQVWPISYRGVSTLEPLQSAEYRTYCAEDLISFAYVRQSLLPIILISEPYSSTYTLNRWWWWGLFSANSLHRKWMALWKFEIHTLKLIGGESEGGGWIRGIPTMDRQSAACSGFFERLFETGACISCGEF